MKKQMIICALAALCLALTGCSAQGTVPFIFGLLALLSLALAILRTYSSVQYSRSRKKKRHRKKESAEQILLTVILYAAALVLVLAAILFSRSDGTAKPGENLGNTTTGSTTDTQPEGTVPTPPITFSPKKTLSSDPSNWGIQWEIFDGTSLVSQYTRKDAISFSAPEDYFALPGIAAFRGNNYRNSATYGTADVVDQTVSLSWTTKTGTLPGSTWSGSGWTGQPLIVQWDKETKSIMNMYESKKNKDGLVEVIYATLEGKIYFLDLEDGSYTRDPINVGMCFKGAGSLDPRGYPLMYVGSGDENSKGDRPRMFIISLVDGSILYEYGYAESLSLREDNDYWCAFDSSPLIHAETDTLIWPGESGILYTMRLNTQYDKKAGTISISPDNMVRTRYDTARSSAQSYWYGYEASANIVENYLYISENGGMFYCIDLNTMDLVWAQDTKDDSNSTPVFERTGEDSGFIYTAPSLHWTRDSNMEGSISIYKLDAITGEIVWERPYHVHTVDGVSGGIQSSPLLGKEGTTIEGMIIYTIARIPDVYTGIMVALDTQTGEEIWRMNMNNYAWSSPVAVYDNDGTAYIVVCDSMGYAFLVDGATGRQLDLISLGGLVEASPAVYENMVIVGTRKELICGIEVK